jgi:hypothetical protein
MWEQVAQLYAHHGDVPAEVRLLNLEGRRSGRGVHRHARAEQQERDLPYS